MTFQCIPMPDAREIQDLALQRIETLEGGIQTIEAGVETQWGLVSLGLDHVGRLVVLLFLQARAEAETVDREPDLFSRLIAIYGWIREVMPLLESRYAERGRIGETLPRMIVVAPEFSRAFVEGSAYLRFKVECYRCQAIAAEGQRDLLLMPLAIQSPEGPPVEASGPSRGFLASAHLTRDELQFFKEDPAELE